VIAFRHPTAFFLLAPFALLVALYAWSRLRRRRELKALGDWRLLAELVPLDGLKRRRHKDRLALAAAAVLVLAATGPQFGSRLKEVKQRGMDVFIALDVSRSMLAEDVPPSRLERAKQSLSLLVGKLEGNRVGVIAFARRAVMQCPLTVDTGAARLLLETVSTHTVPEQGTAVGSAIRLGISRFPEKTQSGRAIVLLTDGEDHSSDPLGAAKEAKAKGVVVFTIGIGTSKGEVIKNRDADGKVTEFLKHNGEMVISRLDDALLTKVAEISGGAYFRSTSTDQEIDEIAEILNGFEKRELNTKVFERLQERYVPFTLFGLFLLILEFFFAETPGQRRRVLTGLRKVRFRRPARTAVTAAALLLVCAASVHADVRSLVREGNRLVKKGDLEGAAKQFESAQIDDPENPWLAFNLATVAHLRGDDEEAVKLFERAAALAKDPALRGRIAYNAGHAYFQMGQSPEAIEKFKEALRLDPRDMDAKYNLEYARSGKKPREQKPKDSKSPPPSPGPTPSEKPSGDKKEQAKASPSPQPSESPTPKPGELSKEDAERILQMTQDEESEKLKARPIRPLGSKESPAASGEEW